MKTDNYVNGKYFANLIKEVFDDGIARIEYCTTAFQAANIFTKALAPAKWPQAIKLFGSCSKTISYFSIDSL